VPTGLLIGLGVIGPPPLTPQATVVPGPPLPYWSAMRTEYAARVAATVSVCPLPAFSLMLSAASGFAVAEKVTAETPVGVAVSVFWPPPGPPGQPPAPAPPAEAGFRLGPGPPPPPPPPAQVAAAPSTAFPQRSGARTVG